MKKIIATVLAMVMALALCSTAFAADTWTVYMDKTGTAVSDAVDWSHVDAKEVDGAGNVEHWTSTTKGVTLVACDKDDAAWSIYKNGGFYCYARNVGTESGANYTLVVDEQDKTSDKASCTKNHYLEDGYLDDDDNFYVEAAGGSTTARISGTQKLVELTKKAVSDSTNVIYASHVLGKATKNSDKGYDEATCLVCGAKVALTSKDDVLAKNSIKKENTYEYKTSYADYVKKDNKNNDKYTFAVGTEFAGNYDYAWDLSSSSSTTTDGKTSPKTFDAGVAMYVGMALASVTGSAVVIGKKKEF